MLEIAVDPALGQDAAGIVEKVGSIVDWAAADKGHIPHIADNIADTGVDTTDQG